MTNRTWNTNGKVITSMLTRKRVTVGSTMLKIWNMNMDITQPTYGDRKEKILSMDELSALHARTLDSRA